MNRHTAIARARELIRRHAARVNNVPVIDVDEYGNFHVKIGTGGLLIRLSRQQEPIEPDQAEG